MSSRSCLQRNPVLAVALLLSSSTSVASAAVLVDIDRNASGETAAGYTQMLTGADTIASMSKVFTGIAAADVDDGTFTVNINGFQTNGTTTAAASLGSRSRSAPTYAGLPAGTGAALRDFVFLPSANNQGRAYMAVSFVGLTANKTYEISVFSYDNNGVSATNWTTALPSVSIGYNTNPFPAHVNLTNSSGNVVPTKNTGGAAPTNTSNPSGGTTFTLTTDAGGNVTLYAWGGSGVDGANTSGSANPYLNAFTITPVVVPEPVSLGLLGLGAAGVLGRGRTK